MSSCVAPALDALEMNAIVDRSRSRQAARWQHLEKFWRQMHRAVFAHDEVTLACVRFFADAAVANRDAAAKRRADFLIVRHHYHCRAELGVGSVDQLDDARCGYFIELARRFIGKQ